jgi:hypothetical protein
VEHSQCVGLTNLPPFVSRLSKQCRILNISQPSRPPRRVMEIACTFKSKSKSCYDWWSVSQYVLVSSALWDFDQMLILSCLCEATSLIRGQVCLLSVTVSNICQDCFHFLFFSFSFFFLHFTWHICFMYIQYVQGLCQRRLSTADHAPSFVAYTTIVA